MIFSSTTGCRCPNFPAYFCIRFSTTRSASLRERTAATCKRNFPEGTAAILGLLGLAATIGGGAAAACVAIGGATWGASFGLEGSGAAATCVANGGATCAGFFGLEGGGAAATCVANGVVTWAGFFGWAGSGAVATCVV